MPSMRTTKPKARRVTFEHIAAPDSEVYLTGSPWEWKPDAKKMKRVSPDGHFSITVMLPRGVHEYKFVVDGTWSIDPTCREWVPNPFGTLNNTITVS
jgi:1,4-alpha-glucan branching enzyme